MEAKEKALTRPVVRITHIVAWVIFIGLSIKTGAIIYSFFVSLYLSPAASANLHLGLDLSELKEFGVTHYSLMVLCITALSALKAYMFYFVIKIFLEINFNQPFNVDMAALITKISYVALSIGILGVVASGYREWLIKKEPSVSILAEYTNGSSEFLFFAGIIFIISLVFKRGIEIQSENELTV